MDPLTKLRLNMPPLRSAGHAVREDTRRSGRPRAAITPPHKGPSDSREYAEPVKPQAPKLVAAPVAQQDDGVAKLKAAMAQQKRKSAAPKPKPRPSALSQVVVEPGDKLVTSTEGLRLLGVDVAESQPFFLSLRVHYPDLCLPVTPKGSTQYYRLSDMRRMYERFVLDDPVTIGEAMKRLKIETEVDNARYLVASLMAIHGGIESIYKKGLEKAYRFADIAALIAKAREVAAEAHAELGPVSSSTTLPSGPMLRIFGIKAANPITSMIKLEKRTGLKLSHRGEHSQKFWRVGDVAEALGRQPFIPPID